MSVNQAVQTLLIPNATAVGAAPFPLARAFGNLQPKRDRWEGPTMEYWVQIAVGTAALFGLLASAIEGARLWRSRRRTHR